MVKILDAYQFNNGVIRADHRFIVMRRNEVFVTAEDEESYTRAAQLCDCGILCRRDIRRPQDDGGHVENEAARSNGLEVDLHTVRRLQDFGLANARGASSRSGFRARADKEHGRASLTKRHTIAEGGTGYFIAPQGANPDTSPVPVPRVAFAPAPPRKT